MTTTPSLIRRRTLMTLEVILPKSIASLAACLVIHAMPALAAPGDLDTSFGTGGEIVDSLGHDAGIGRAVLVQPDGRIVVAGAAEQGSWLSDFAIIRYLPDGTRDTSFGQNGRVFTKVGGTNTSGRSLALQTDGKLIVAGRAAAGQDRFDFALARYHPNGAVDIGFGSSGLATLALGGTNGVANSVIIQSNGRIVVAGEYRINEQDRMMVARFLADGTLDPSFGNGGKMIPFIGGVWDSASSVVIQPDGKIVVGGSLSETNVQQCFALVRFQPNGTLDESFGTGGKVTTLIGGDTYSGGQNVVLQVDGKIVLTGYSWGDGLDMALARYHSDGTLDSNFGEGGMVVTSFVPGAPELAYGAALQRDGKIVVTGTSEADGTNCLTVVRYQPNGALDTSFGNGGRATSSFGRNSAYYDSPGRGVVVQSDGKIIAVGGTDVGFRTLRLALARYIGATEPEITVDLPWGNHLTDGFSSVDFGTAVVSGGIGYNVFQIINVGVLPLTGLAARIDGANADDFVILDAPFTSLSPGSVGYVEVAFSPTAPGPRTAVLHIDSNDADESPFDIVLTGTSLPEQVITTGGPLPCGTVGVPYSVRFAASGGVAPYSWWCERSHLPAGLSLSTDGVLSGTPTAATNVILTVFADGDGPISSRADKTFDLRIFAPSESGALDTTFGTGGKVTTGVAGPNSRANGMAVRSDGKLLVAGSAFNGGNYDFALLCYLANGGLDTSFGNQGMITTPIGNSHDSSQGVAVQADGKIVAAGSANNGTDSDFAVVRYQANGELDTNFGSGGKVITSFLNNSGEVARGVAVEPDGKIVVAGFSDNGTVHDVFALTRYQANGTLDTTFGIGGKVTTAVGNDDDQGYSVALQSDGKILVAGSSENAGNSDFALVRYTANGALDTSFGNGGKVVTPIGSGDDSCRSMALQGDGKIVLAGSSSSSGIDNFDVALARYLPDGTLDATFGNGGKVITDLGGGSDDSGHGVIVLPDGNILVAGTSDCGGNYDFALVQYRPDGSVDATFGSGGRMITPVGNSDDIGWSLALQKDGNIVVAGDSRNGTDYDFSLVRYIGSPDNAAQPPHVATASPLPSGMVGLPYDLALTASGGAGPYAWSIIEGSLPAGLALSATGLIQGTPTSVANAGFTVCVTGNNGLAATNVFALTILQALKPGDLDPSFGTNGRVTLAFGSGDDYGYSAAVQSDDKIVVAGYSMTNGYEKFALARYLADGMLDTSFGNGGKVTTSLSPYRDYGRAVTVQIDGKIVVAGEATTSGGYKISLVRYLADGTLDSTFGSGGRVTNSIGLISYAKSVMIQSDAKIVVAGQMTAHCADFGLARYLADGSLDTTFGSGGMVATDFGTNSCDYSQGAALQPDGKILVAGYAPGLYGTNGTDFALVRYLANGSLDTAFGNGAKVTTPIASGSGGDLGRSVAVQSDGKIVVAGEFGGGDFVLVRYLADGTLDNSFGSGGKVTTAINNYGGYGRSVVVQSDGKIVVAGECSNGSNSDFAVARYNTDGTLDVSFGTGGKFTSAVGSGHDHGRSVVLQSDGKIVVAGDSYNGTNYDFALVRYIGSREPEIAVEQPAGTKLTDSGAEVTFGAVALGGTPVVRNFTVRNIGSASLNGLAVNTDGPSSSDFTVSDLGTTNLAPGASISFNVTFAPGGLGSRTAALHIASNDADENSFDIPLTGTGGSYSPLQAWRLAHFGSPDDSGDGANSNDFDQDGFINILEYAFGGDPKTPDATVQRPRASLVGYEHGLAVSFWCDARCTDITYTVQASRNLETGSWIDIARSEGGRSVSPVAPLGIGLLWGTSDPSTGLRTARVHVYGPYFLEGPRFLRVTVSE